MVFTLRDPHAILWLIAIAVIIMAPLLGFFRDILADIMVISGLFVLFNLIDPLIFDVRGNSVVTLFSGNLFTGRWQAFPVFLLELYLFSLVSNSVLEPFVRSIVHTEISSIGAILVWFAALFAFYWFRGSRD